MSISALTRKINFHSADTYRESFGYCQDTKQADLFGPDAILNGVFVRLGANHEYFNLKGIQLHNMSDNMVLATLRYDAKVISTGKAYDAQAAHLWILNDAGKIMSFQQYVDTKKLADAEN